MPLISSIYGTRWNSVGNSDISFGSSGNIDEQQKNSSEPEILKKKVQDTYQSSDTQKTEQNTNDNYTKYVNPQTVSKNNKEASKNTDSENKTKESNAQKNSNPSEKSANWNELSDSEEKQVEELKQIDTKVKAHEAAHKAAGAGLVRGGSFSYTTGPDGNQYATGGEVQIDMSYDSEDPEGTIRKMQQVQRAALAPADPSPQDRSVASTASQLEAKARNELSKQNSQDTQTKLNSAKLANAYGNTQSNNESEKGQNVDFTVGTGTKKLDAYTFF